MNRHHIHTDSNYGCGPNISPQLWFHGIKPNWLPDCHSSSLIKRLGARGTSFTSGPIIQTNKLWQSSSIVFFKLWIFSSVSHSKCPTPFPLHIMSVIYKSRPHINTRNHRRTSHIHKHISSQLHTAAGVRRHPLTLQRVVTASRGDRGGTHHFAGQDVWQQRDARPCYCLLDHL